MLRDEGEKYANKLREAANDVTSLRVLGMVHDFLLLDSLRDTKAANVARKLSVDLLSATPSPPADLDSDEHGARGTQDDLDRARRSSRALSSTLGRDGTIPPREDVVGSCGKSRRRAPP